MTDLELQPYIDRNVSVTLVHGEALTGILVAGVARAILNVPYAIQTPGQSPNEGPRYRAIQDAALIASIALLDEHSPDPGANS